MSNRVQRNCLNPALVFTLLLYDFIVVCTFDIIHQFLVPTIWNSVSCRFVSRELNSVQNCFYEKMPNEILLPNGLLSLELFEQFEAKMRNKKWRKNLQIRQDKGT